MALATLLGLLLCLRGRRMWTGSVTITGLVGFGALGSALIAKFTQRPFALFFGGIGQGVLGAILLVIHPSLVSFGLGMALGVMLGTVVGALLPTPPPYWLNMGLACATGRWPLFDSQRAPAIISALLGAWVFGTALAHFAHRVDFIWRPTVWAGLPPHVRGLTLLAWLFLAAIGLLVQKDRPG